MHVVHYKKVVGLDIGAHSVKAVLAVRRQGRLCCEGTERVRLPSKKSERQRVLQAFMERNGWADLPCVVSVLGQSIMLHTIDMPVDSHESVQEVVRHELDQFDDLADEGTIHDHALQGAASGRPRNILLAVGRTDVIAHTIEELSHLGFNVVDAVPGALAVFNAVGVLHRKTAGPLVCVDVGHESTEVVVGQRKRILYARRFARGAGSLVSSASGSSGSGIGGIVVEELDRWIDELRSCLAAYASRFSGKRLEPRQIVLCGGGALVDGLVEKISGATGINAVVLGSSGRNMGIDGVHFFATAVGLAMQGIGTSRPRLSLLPRHVRERIVLRWQRKYWGLSGSLLILAVAWMICATYTGLKDKRALLEERKTEIARLRDLEQRVVKYDGMNEDLQMQILPFRTAVRNGEIVRAVIYALGEAKHPDDWIVLVADAVSYAADEADSGPTRSESGGGAEGVGAEDALGVEQIVIEGYTPVEDLSTVRAMIETLRGSPGIIDADLLGDDLARIDEARDKRWESTKSRLFAVQISVPAR